MTLYAIKIRRDECPHCGFVSDFYSKGRAEKPGDVCEHTVAWFDDDDILSYRPAAVYSKERAIAEGCEPFASQPGIALTPIGPKFG